LTLLADIVWEEKIIKKLKNCVKTRQNYSRPKNKRQNMTRQVYMRQDSDTPIKTLATIVIKKTSQKSRLFEKL
jgi:hypothetical protein